MGNNSASGGGGSGSGSSNSENSTPSDYVYDELGYTAEQIQNMDWFELSSLGEDIYDRYRGNLEVEVYNGPDGDEFGNDEEYSYFNITPEQFGAGMADVITSNRGASSLGMAPEDIVTTALAHVQTNGDYSIFNGKVNGFYSQMDKEPLQVLQDITDKYSGGRADPDRIMDEIETNIIEYHRY